MKKLVVRMTSSECQYESALHLWLLLWIFESTGFSIHLNPADRQVRAKSSLTVSDQISFDDLPLKKKIGFLVWFAPVYILSAVFRILTLALLFD